MDAIVKKNLIELSNSKNIDQVIFCLQLLLNEIYDNDFKDTFCSVLINISKYKLKEIQSREENIKESLNRIHFKLGQDDYLNLITNCPSDISPISPICLEIIDPSTDKIDHQLLIEIAKWPKLPSTTIKWLAKVAFANNSSNSILLLTPFFKEMALKIDADQEDHDDKYQITQLICQNQTLQKDISDALKRGRLLPPVAAGMILILSFAKNPEHIQIIGPYIEDIIFMDHIMDMLFQKERIKNIFDRAEEVRLSIAINKLIKESQHNNKSLSELFSDDYELRRSFSRFISGQSSFIAVCRILVDPGMIGAFKELFSDSDLLCRKAVAIALKEIGTDKSIYFLKSGLVDRNKKVRQLSSVALRSIVGDDEFDNIVIDMRKEITSLKDRLKGLVTLSNNFLESIKSSASSSAEFLGGAALWFGEKTKEAWGKISR